jgi:TonB family protein
MRRLTPLVVVLISAAAMAGAPRFADETRPGETHVRGELKWTDSLVRNASDLCANASMVGAMATGRPSSRPPREDAADCVRNSVAVRNESPRPIQCRMQLDLETPDEGDQLHRETEMVIFPGVQELGAQSFGLAAQPPKDFSSECVIVPKSLLPEETIPDGCQVTISGPDPEQFYPPGAKRRNEQGRAVLEYSVAEDSNKPADVLLVGTSGYQDLDNAALKYAKSIRVKQACVDRRYQLGVSFALRDS